MNSVLKKALLSPFDVLYDINPEFELKLMWFLKKKHRLNLDDPQTFNEKLNWLKLNHYDEKMLICADKLRVRDYVKSKKAEETLVALLWSGDDPEDIDFDDLPNQFVIKTTHGSGNNIICKDKGSLDLGQVVSCLKKWLKEKYLRCYGEWVYKDNHPKVICEELLGADCDDLPDYKVFCFNGVPKLIEVDFDRFTDHKRNIYTRDWEFVDASIGFPNAPERQFKKPELLEEMLSYAEKLSSDFPFARVDFYLVKGRVYFGEITFFHGAGYDKFSSKELEMSMGRWLDLTKINKKDSAL